MIEKPLPESCDPIACMIAPDDCQSYLQGIYRRYEQWLTENALTEAIADRQATFSFEQMVQTEEKDSEGKPKRITLPLFNAIENYIKSEHILLVGSPGVGKSTALWRCLVQLAKGEREKPEPRLPILVSMKKYKSSFSSSEDPSGMLTLIRNALPPKIRRKVSVSEVEELLFDNQLILLLDGLNEMPADSIRTHLKAFREECQESQVPLICTTRELGGGDLGIQRRLEIQPLRREEVERFLQNCIPDQKQKVLQLVNRDNRELSRTPFVLWMLYDLFQKQVTEVETLAEAFHQFFQSSKKYKEDAPVSDERRQEWNCWLEHLAFTMLSHPDPTEPGLVISKKQAEKNLIEKFGGLYGASSRVEELLKYHLLEPISEKEISFHHQLIQEYYAAECLLTQLPDLLKKQPEQQYTPFQMDYLNYVKWTEAIALMLGFPEIIQEQTLQVLRVALDVDFMLSARLTGKVKTILQKEVISLFKQLNISKRFQLELFGLTKSEYTIRDLNQSLDYDDPIICQAATFALKNIGTKAVIPGLLKALSNKYERVRGIAAIALGDIGGETEITALSDVLNNENDSVVIWDAAFALKRIGGKTAISVLNCALYHSNSKVSQAATSALELMRTEESSLALKQAFDEGHPEVIVRKAEDYSEAIYEGAAIFWLKLLRNPQPLAYELAVSVLEEINIEEAVSIILSSLKSEEPISRWNTNALGETGIKVALPVLIRGLKEGNSYTRSDAAFALGKLGREIAVPDLIEALLDEKLVVRESAINALGGIGDNRATPHLIEILFNDNEELDTRRSAVFALGSIASEEAESSILRTLTLSDSELRASAAYSLGIIGSDTALEILCSIVDNDEDSNVRTSAIEALGELPSEASISVLVRTLSDDDLSVRDFAISSLKQFQESDLLPILLKAMQSAPAEAASSIMSAIQSRCGFYNYKIYQYTQEVSKLENSADFIGQLYKDIDRAIYQIERNPELRQKDGEDRLTIEIVGSLREALRNSGHSVNHDCKIGGHVDLTIEKDNFVWLGEAKIYKDNNYLWEGFQQLTTRYSTGDANQNSGGLLIYIFDENAKSVMEKWQNYLLSKSLPSYSCKPCKIRSLSFISSHRHERSGDCFHVRHMPVLLHFAPKDKSGRRRKNKL